MAKTVVTYSWLARKAMSLFKKDRHEYDMLLTTAGSDKLIRGARVQWRTHGDTSQWFRIIVNSKTFCRLFGVEVGGKFYTRYEPRFTTTQYKKRLVDKYLPFSLPDGVRSYHNPSGHQTKCIYHNADGSVACEGYWWGGRRNRQGTANKTIVICDDTGEFIQAPDDRMLNYDYPCLMRLGWFEDASRTRRDWIESVRQMPHCDTDKVLEMAAKAYLAASRMCEKYPKMRMAMFPAGPYSDEAGDRGHGFHSGCTPAILDRASDGVPVQWYLPEVIVYWREDQLETPEYVTLTMVIPPHGCPLMDPSGGCGVLSKRVRGAKVMDYWSKVPLPRGYTRAHHAVQAYDPSTPVEHQQPFSSVSPYYWEYGNTTATQHSQEKWMVNWLNHRNKVVAWIKAPCVSENEVSLPMPIDVPIAMKPEDVLLAFEEKMLLESLPLC